MNMYEMISGMKAPTTPAVDERTAESISVFFRPGGDGDVDHYSLWNGDFSGGDDDGDHYYSWNGDASGGDGDVDHYYLWNGDASGGDGDGDNGGVPYDIDNTNHKWGVYKNNEVTYSQYSVQIYDK